MAAQETEISNSSPNPLLHRTEQQTILGRLFAQRCRMMGLHRHFHSTYFHRGVIQKLGGPNFYSILTTYSPRLWAIYILPIPFVHVTKPERIYNSHYSNAMGCRQCLSLTVVQLKSKHYRKPHWRNGVVDTFGPS